MIYLTAKVAAFWWAVIEHKDFFQNLMVMEHFFQPSSCFFPFLRGLEVSKTPVPNSPFIIEASGDFIGTNLLFDILTVRPVQRLEENQSKAQINVVFCFVFHCPLNIFWILPYLGWNLFSRPILGLIHFGVGQSRPNVRRFCHVGALNS